MPELQTILFFGTPEFAVPSLRALARAGREPALVVAQPDRRAGRGKYLKRPAIAQAAEELELPLLQTPSVRDEEVLNRIAALEPDLGVVVAFGQIFPLRLLELPRLGCVNLHASLLPRWRGAAPIQAAIAAGDRQTGVTTVQMEMELDAGPILLQRQTEIGEEETSPELASRLAELGSELVLETVSGLKAGTLAPRPQEEGLVTWAPTLDRADGRVDWSWSAEGIFNRLRAFVPWPGIFTEAEGEPLKILAARPVTGEAAAVPGTVLSIDDQEVVVACGDGTALVLEELQRPGRRAMSAGEVARGLRLTTGGRLG